MPVLRQHPQQPPGGHSFPDPSGVLIKADSVDALLLRIAEYRAVNGFHAGNPEAELESYYSMTYPWLITKVGEVSHKADDRAIKWLNRIWKEAPRRLNEKTEYDARIKECQSCEHYTQRAYVPDDLRRLLTISADRSTDRSECGLHGWIVGLAASLPLPEPKPEINFDCWACRRNISS